jgi:FlaA1/EpsC-like NDP-sugar epimerase
MFGRVRSILFGLPRFAKQVIVAVTDFILSFLAVWIAYLLRLDAFNIPRSSPQLVVYFLSPTILIFTYWRLGIYRAIFRYSGSSVLKTLVKGIFIQALLYFFIIWILSNYGVIRLGSTELPRSLLFIVPLLCLLITGGSRAIAYSFLTGFKANRKGFRHTSRLLIYGAGAAGIQAYSAIKNSPLFTLLGFIDDNPLLHGREIEGNRIYSFNELDRVIPNMRVTDIVLAIPALSRSERFKILERLRTFPVHVRSLPNIDEIAAGQIVLQDLKELDVVDLLGRSTIEPDRDLIDKKIENKIILITGAGGSIGSELSRQILKSRPAEIVLFEVNEFALYSIEKELIKNISNGRYSNIIKIIPLLGSIRDSIRVEEVVKTYKPDIIFHAAAYKHVPLVEMNPFEGIRNNVMGTLTLAEIAARYQTKNFVLISTDKAVRPTNIMGASKRLAELILQALASSHTETIFSMVRFGNVLGSSGSVVPLFRQQIEQGGPITLTDYEVTRFFMSIPEAAELVIQASAMAAGGEVFVLDMGEPVKIYDLALKMVELSGLTVKNDENPQGDIEIIKVGLRPGEKLYEELLIGENPQSTIHPRIMQAKESFLALDNLKNELNLLESSMLRNDGYLVLKQLKKLVSGFIPDPRSWK